MVSLKSVDDDEDGYSEDEFEDDKAEAVVTEPPLPSTQQSLEHLGH